MYAKKVGTVSARLNVPKFSKNSEQCSVKRCFTYTLCEYLTGAPRNGLRNGFRPALFGKSATKVIWHPALYGFTACRWR